MGTFSQGWDYWQAEPLNQWCIDNDIGYLCMFPEHSAQSINYPVLVMYNLYARVIFNNLGFTPGVFLYSDIVGFTDESEEYVQMVYDHTVDTLNYNLLQEYGNPELNVQSGYFAPACDGHSFVYEAMENFEIDGITLMDVIRDWVDSEPGSAPQSLMDDLGLLVENDHCGGV